MPTVPNAQELPHKLQTALVRSVHEEITRRQAENVVTAGYAEDPDRFDITAATESMTSQIKFDPLALRAIITGIVDRPTMPNHAVDCHRLLSGIVGQEMSTSKIANQSDILVASSSLRSLNKSVLPLCAKAARFIHENSPDPAASKKMEHPFLEELVANPNDPRAPAVLVMALRSMGMTIKESNNPAVHDVAFAGLVQRFNVAITQGDASAVSDLAWQLPCDADLLIESIALYYAASAGAFEEADDWQKKGEDLPPAANHGPKAEEPLECQYLSHDWGTNWRRMDLDHHLSMMKFSGSRLIGRGWIKVTLDPNDPDLAKVSDEEVALGQDETHHEAAWIVGIGSNPEHIMPVAAAKFVRIHKIRGKNAIYHTAIGNIRYSGEKSMLAEEGYNALGYMASTQVIDDMEYSDGFERIIMNSNTIGDPPKSFEGQGVQSVGVSYSEQLPSVVITLKKVIGEGFQFLMADGTESTFSDYLQADDNVITKSMEQFEPELYCAKVMGSDPWGATVFINTDTDAAIVVPLNPQNITPELEAEFDEAVRQTMDDYGILETPKNIANMRHFEAAYHAGADIKHPEKSGFAGVMLKRQKARILVIVHADKDYDGDYQILAVRYIKAQLGQTIQDATAKAMNQALDDGAVGIEITDPRYDSADELDDDKCNCPACIAEALQDIIDSELTSDQQKEMSGLQFMPDAGMAHAVSGQDIKGMAHGMMDHYGKPGIYWTHVLVGLKPGAIPDLSMALKRIGRAIGCEISNDMVIREWGDERRVTIHIAHHTQEEPENLLPEIEFLRKKAKPTFVEMIGIRTDIHQPISVSIEEGRTKAVLANFMGGPAN